MEPALREDADLGCTKIEGWGSHAEVQCTAHILFGSFVFLGWGPVLSNIALPVQCLPALYEQGGIPLLTEDADLGCTI